MTYQLFPHVWLKSRDGDPSAFRLHQRHYSAHHYRDGRRRAGYRNRFLFVGPGEKLVLMTPNCNALFVWRKFIDNCLDERTGNRQEGVNCAIFRNESSSRSSDMISAAEDFAWQKWPSQRLYTYVNAEKTKRRRGRANPPGWCFICAGWEVRGRTKGGLVILEKLFAQT